MQNKVSYIVIIVLAFVCLILSMKLGQQSDVAETRKNSAVSGSSEFAEENKSSVPKVAVFARESKKFAADEYVLSVELSMVGTDKKVLYRKMGEKRNRLFEILKSVGISESNVEQSSIELSKEWDYDYQYANPGKRSFLGFSSSQKFKVHVGTKQLKKDFIQLLSAEPDFEIKRSEPQLKDMAALQAKVVKNVCDKALAKAENYAQGAGGKLGKILMANGNVDQDRYSWFEKADSVEIEASLSLEMELLSNEKAASSNEPVVLFVHNNEERKYAADEFEANFTLEIVGTNKKSLYELMEKRRVSILERLDSLDIPRTDVDDFDIKLQKNRTRPMAKVRSLGEFGGYSASKCFKVYVKSMDVASALVNVLAQERDVEFSGVTPKLKNRDSLTAKIEILTSQKAMEKAEAFAAGLGMKVGKIVDVDDGMVSREYWNEYRGKLAPKSYGGGIVLGNDMPPPSRAIADSVTVGARINYVVELQ